MNVLIALLAVLLLGGCTTRAHITGRDDPRNGSAGEMAEQQEEDEVLALVNGEEITIGEYNERMKQLSVYEKARYRGEEGHREFLNVLIQRKLMVQRAKELGLDRDQGVQEKIEALMLEVTERVLIEALVKREVLGKVVVTDKEAKAYYNEHKEDFRAREKIRIRHILVATEEEALEVRQELKEGADFAKLASERSIDQNTAKRGGDLGYLEHGNMPAELEKAYSELKIGDVGEPVKTRLGYHVMKLEDRKEASVKEFYEVSDGIKKRLTSDKQRKEHQEWLRQLEERAKIEIETSFGGPPTELP